MHGPFVLSSVPMDNEVAVNLELVGAFGMVVGTVATSKPVEVSAPTPEPPPKRDPPPRRDRDRDRDRDDRKDSGPKGKISVASKPPGTVYIDGRSTGRKTPLRAHSVKGGYHKVKVKYPDGSYSGEKRALVKPGVEVKLLFRQ